MDPSNNSSILLVRGDPHTILKIMEEMMRDQLFCVSSGTTRHSQWFCGRFLLQLFECKHHHHHHHDQITWYILGGWGGDPPSRGLIPPSSLSPHSNPET